MRSKLLALLGIFIIAASCLADVYIPFKFHRSALFRGIIGSGIWTNRLSSTWTTTNSWLNGGIAYGSGSSAIFTNTTGVTVTNDYAGLILGHIYVSNATYNIVGGSIALDSPIAVSTVNVGNASQTLNLGSTLTGTNALMKAGPGTLVLTGTNTYTGGTILNGGTLTITDPRHIGNTNAPITFAGTSTLSMNTATVLYWGQNSIFTINSGATATLGSQNGGKYFRGPLVGSGGLILSATTSFGFLSTSNTFTGIITSGTGGSTGYGAEFTSLPDVSVVNLGTSVNAGTLRWMGQTGPIVFTNRQFCLSGTTLGGTIAAEGVTANDSLTILPSLAITGTGSKTFTLAGSSASTNTFSGAITNGLGSVISLTRSGTTPWILSGTNTYSGDTTISQGSLTFNSIDAVSPNTTFRIASGAGAKAGLNYAGTKNINALYLNNINQPIGTYGATNATFVFTSYFANDGLLNVLWGDGTWTNLTGGNWDVASNWRSNGIAIGYGSTANFTNVVGGIITNNYASLALTNANFIFTNGNYTITGNTSVLDGPSASIFNVGGANTTATIANNLSGTNSITKSGSGSLVLLGTNSFSALTMTAGSLIINGGQVTNTTLNYTGISSITVTNGGRLTSGPGNSVVVGGQISLCNFNVVGGSGVTSLWNVANNDLSIGNNTFYSNDFVTVNGNGVEGSAVITNIANLVIGRSGVNLGVTLTNGARIYTTTETRIGSQYYASGYTAATNNVLTIIGGTASSIFTGNGGNSFYIGYPERPGAAYNRVIVANGGILTNVGFTVNIPEVDFSIGDASSTVAPVVPVQNNKLIVRDGGKAFMVRNINIGATRANTVSSYSNTLEVINGGYVNVSGGINVGYVWFISSTNGYNNVIVTNGGQLITSGATNYIGRANTSALTAARSDNNSVLVGQSSNGTNAIWNLSNQNLYIGFNSFNTINNLLTVNNGGAATNINRLYVNATNTLQLGSGGNIYAANVTNLGTMAINLDNFISTTSGCLRVTGNLNITNATLNIITNNIISPAYIIATYGTLTGAYIQTNNLPAEWSVNYQYNGSNQIALITPNISNLNALVSSPSSPTTYGEVCVKINSGAENRYIRSYSASTNGASWDTTKTISGPLNTGSLTSAAYVNLGFGTTNYYVQTYLGNTNSDICSNIIGTETNGTFTSSGFVPVYINNVLNYIQVWTLN